MQIKVYEIFVIKGLSEFRDFASKPIKQPIRD
jgi:hypothetical protein